jgi:hypothetical protein
MFLVLTRAGKSTFSNHSSVHLIGINTQGSAAENSAPTVVRSG